MHDKVPNYPQIWISESKWVNVTARTNKNVRKFPAVRSICQKKNTYNRKVYIVQPFYISKMKYQKEKRGLKPTELKPNHRRLRNMFWLILYHNSHSMYVCMYVLYIPTEASK